MTRLRRTRLVARDLSVDVRWFRHNGRWIASADTPGGPSLGMGWTAREALTAALQPLDGVVIEGLLDTVSDEPPHG
jgi:hypothetical protein